MKLSISCDWQMLKHTQQQQLNPSKRMHVSAHRAPFRKIKINVVTLRFAVFYLNPHIVDNNAVPHFRSCPCWYKCAAAIWHAKAYTRHAHTRAHTHRRINEFKCAHCKLICLHFHFVWRICQCGLSILFICVLMWAWKCSFCEISCAFV